FSATPHPRIRSETSRQLSPPSRADGLEFAENRPCSRRSVITACAFCMALLMQSPQALPGHFVQTRIEAEKMMANRPYVPVLWLAVAAVGLTISTGPVDAAKTDINVEYDKTFSFAGLKTWTWHPEGKGKVLLALTAESD